MGVLTKIRAFVVGKGTNDVADPAIGSGIDCSEFKTVLVDCKITGTTPTFDVTPLFGNSVAGVYFAGSKVTISANTRFKLDVDNCSDVYFKTDGSTGTTPVISIWVLFPGQ